MLWRYWPTAAGSTFRLHSGHGTTARRRRMWRGRYGGEQAGNGKWEVVGSRKGSLLPLTHAFIDEMVAHALADAPNECCGIIAGADGRAVKLFRATNAEASPYRYSVDPRDLFRIYRECDDN